MFFHKKIKVVKRENGIYEAQIVVIVLQSVSFVQLFEIL